MLTDVFSYRGPSAISTVDQLCFRRVESREERDDTFGAPIFLSFKFGLNSEKKDPPSTVNYWHIEKLIARRKSTRLEGTIFSLAANLVDVGSVSGVLDSLKDLRIWNALFVDNMYCGAFSW
jgi:hypothetical protein